MKATEWIDRAAHKLNGASDYAIAKRIGCRPSALSRYRKRPASTMDDQAAIGIAEILGLDPLQVIADQQAERAKNAKARDFWKQFAAAAAAIMALFFISDLSINTTAYIKKAQTVENIHYANSMWRWWLLARRLLKRISPRRCQEVVIHGIVPRPGAFRH